MTEPALQPQIPKAATILRVLAQCWLAWPAVALLPFFVYMAVIQLEHSFTTANGMARLAFLLLPLCCMALAVSIFAPRVWYRRPVLGWLFLILLPLGVVCVGVVFQVAFRKEAPRRFMEYHLFFGPVIAAMWNLIRILRIRWFTTAVFLLCATVAPRLPFKDQINTIGLELKHERVKFATPIALL